jgi:hypothetical protein
MIDGFHSLAYALLSCSSRTLVAAAALLALVIRCCVEQNPALRNLAAFRVAYSSKADFIPRMPYVPERTKDEISDELKFGKRILGPGCKKYKI